MKVNNFYFLICFAINIYLFVNLGYAHEPWLLSPEQIKLVYSKPAPPVFSSLSWLNVTLILIAVLLLLCWISFNYLFPEKEIFDSRRKINLALFFLRFGIGSTLILLSLGLLPTKDVGFLQEPALIAPEFFSNYLPVRFHLMKYLELILGFCFLLGLLTRITCAIFLLFLIFSLYAYGLSVIQYTGFYLGIIFFLILLGNGLWAILPEKSIIKSYKPALFILQLFTGLNFIYSSITIKLLHPNLDIAILEKYKAFTFGISYEYFTFFMMMTEIGLGLCLILGFRLQIISFILFLLFIFLSINLTENILSHNFVYGILFTFILLGGVPLFRDKQLSK